MEEDVILIHGDVSMDNIVGVRKLLNHPDVYEVHRKGVTPDELDGTVQVLFQCYDSISFHKDLNLSAILKNSLEVLERIKEYFASVGKNANYLGFNLSIEVGLKTFSLIIVSVTDKVDLMIDMVNKELNMLAEKANYGDCIKYKLEMNGELEIIDCKELKAAYTITNPSSKSIE